VDSCYTDATVVVADFFRRITAVDVREAIAMGAVNKRRGPNSTISTTLDFVPVSCDGGGRSGAAPVECP
jgi:hypothetical protein